MAPTIVDIPVNKKKMRDKRRESLLSLIFPNLYQATKQTTEISNPVAAITGSPILSPQKEMSGWKFAVGITSINAP